MGADYVECVSLSAEKKEEIETKIQYRGISIL